MQTKPTRTDNGRQISHYRLVDNRGWVRYQFYSLGDGCESIEFVAVASRVDTTPVHTTYPTGYDSKCPACWLGHGHSEALHQQYIEAK